MKTQKTNYLKNESIYEDLGHSLVLPSIIQKKNLSNSGRNIVLSNSHYPENEKNISENFRNNNNNQISNYGNFGNFASNLSNNFGKKGNVEEKVKLDYEISKLEEQYKDILTKFTYLSKKRELLN